MNKIEKHAGSTILTLMVVALLLASGPASAVNLDINGLMGSYKQGKDIKFKVEVEINHGDTDNELLTIQYANVNFAKKGSEWSQTCKIIDEETVEGCDFLQVKKIDVTGDNNYGYGPGFGYDSGTGYNLGYGYGYGYGTNGYKNAKVTYELVIESKDLKAGKYTAQADVYAGTTSPRTFSSEETKFTIFEKKGGNEKEHKVEEKKHHDIKDDDAGIELEIDTDSNSSGSVIIDYYDDNPVNDNSGVSDKKSAKKYVDIVLNGTIENMTNATIRLYYSNSNVAGIDEDTLGIYYWNPSTEKWEFVGNAKGSDAKGKYVSANTTHFSLYALFGNEAVPVPLPTQPSGGNSGYTPEKKADEKKTEQPKVQESPKTETLTPPSMPEKPKQEAPLAPEKKVKTPPTGFFLTSTASAGVAALIVFFAGGLYLRKKGII